VSNLAFQRQYRATGRDKGGGYDPSMFADMDAGELAEAKRLLLRRGLSGDTIDLAGLRFVGDASVVAALRGAAGSEPLRPPDRDLVLRETLFALTGEPGELEPVLAWLDGRDPEARRRAAELLARLALPPTLASPIALRLGRWWLGRAALPLASAWLATQGLPTHRSDGSETHLPLVRRVLAAWPCRRAGVRACWRRSPASCGRRRHDRGPARRGDLHAGRRVRTANVPAGPATGRRAGGGAAGSRTVAGRAGPTLRHLSPDAGRCATLLPACR
jgi:hypothetical protein